MLYKIKIHPLTYILFLVSFLSGYFKRVFFIFMIVLIHEIGHIITAKLLGYRIEKIEILPFGGLTIINKNINDKIIHDILISISGVFFQYIICTIILLFVNNPDTYQIIKSYNNILFIFNMIPIIPLDGYRLLKALIEYIFSYRISNIIGISISIFNIVLFGYYNYLYNIDNYLIISFLIYKAYEEYRLIEYMQNKFYLERILKKYEFAKIKIIDRVNLSKMKKENYHLFKTNNRYVEEDEILAKKFDKGYFI